ncbi:DNA-binding protein Ewg isoform X2 [Arctopsyche grandis]|uniref:DNA-binding protein Ewg isoform X2 n=1 Tax=Arctopsyche grandis TaxID=121162 RepID=UPI00406D641B
MNFKSSSDYMLIKMNSVKDESVDMMEDGDGGLTGESENDDDGCPSSPGSTYDDSTDLITVAMSDEVTAQLAAAGPVGMAAAAAIASSKKRKRPHSFETNPSIRKRQQNRLLRKLRQTIDEFATRVGQQAVVLVATPGKPNTSYRVFGAKPLEDVIKNLRSMIMEELEQALAQQAPPPVQDDPSLYELPPLIIDGIPTPVEKMTQAQLRAFIPLMLKYSAQRGKPGWGRESMRPPWWPKELPWANVRMDARTEDEKQKISWTHALRQIVINCYKYHGREDLLPDFSEEDEKANTTISSSSSMSQYAPAVLQTITNPDGTVSIIQIHTSGADGVHTVQTLDNGDGSTMSVDLNAVTEATLNQDGQIILTGEDGQGYPVSVSGVITLPVSGGMYQTMVANIQQIHTGSDGAVCVTPVVQVDSNGDPMETISMGPGMTQMMIQGPAGTEPQVLQVLSLKDATVLTKAMAAIGEVKAEQSETIVSDQ